MTPRPRIPAGLLLYGWALALAVSLSAPVPAAAKEPAAARFPAGTVPLSQGQDYLRAQPAPDFWTLSLFYIPQQTNSACSLATVTMLVNALRGLPADVAEPLLTQNAVLAAVANPRWTDQVAEGGDGVTFAEFVAVVQESLADFGLTEARVELFRPADATPGMLDRLRALLAANERSDRDIALVYFNQGVLAGDWDGPHLSPIGAYDAARRRVLILDVDREWQVPYWTEDERLLAAMLRPAPPDQGVLAGETGGLVRVILPGAE